jgi:hypothetical protein
MFNLFKKKKISTAETSSYGETYWNTKYPTSPIVYSGRTLKTNHSPIKIDVKNFICDNDNIILDVLKRNRLIKTSFNETALAIQKWVAKNIKYVADDTSNKCPEFWQFPFETLAGKIGDCEDGGILMASMLINAGIPAWRVKVAAGYVQEAPTAPQGGHAYCIYLADRPESEKKLEWVVLDWCYYEDSATPIEKKPLAKNGGFNGCYKDTWFTFNNANSWNQTKLELDGRVK